MRTKHRLVDAAMVLLLPLLMAYSLFLADYISIMILFAMLGYGVTRLLEGKL